MRAYQIIIMTNLFFLKAGLCTNCLPNDHNMFYYLFEIVI